MGFNSGFKGLRIFSLYLVTFLVISRSRVVLVKLTVSQILTSLSSFHTTLIFMYLIPRAFQIIVCDPHESNPMHRQAIGGSPGQLKWHQTWTAEVFCLLVCICNKWFSFSVREWPNFRSDFVANSGSHLHWQTR